MFCVTKTVFVVALVPLVYLWKRVDNPIPAHYGIFHSFIHLLTPFDGEHFLKLANTGYTNEINHAFFPLTSYLTSRLSYFLSQVI